MNWLSQTTRFLQLDLPLGKETLMPINFSGSETLSQPFNFSLQAISDNINIDPAAILGKPITLSIHTNDRGLIRYFNGYVTKFHAEQVVEGNRYYRAEIQPWLSFLNFSSDCQVFQQKTVVQIAEAIFKQFKFTHFDTTGLSNSYKPRNYCVQYRETSLHFLSRLFQEEGIYYFFKHEDGKHTLMLADSPTAIKPATDALAVYTAGSHQAPAITQFTRQYQFYSGKAAHTDYNHTTPDNSLHAQQQGSAKLKAAENYEQFDYPGLYEDNSSGNSRAQQRFEAQEAQYDSLHGKSNYVSFSCGSKFSIENAPAASDNGDYAITTVMHYATDGSYLHDDTGNQSYYNTFICIPATTPYQSSIHYHKPLVHGAQSAWVVGGPNEELETSDYGQVKVQFHWDRKGKKDEYSSCWLRVAQLWAGKNWGALFIPRIGQEVLVHFLEGDPDRPVIMGTVYNADNMPPYSLPGSQSRSGIRTSSTKGAAADEYNELYFEDRHNSEEIYIQAQKDFNKLVKNNLGVKVQNDHTHVTKHDSSITVGNDHSHTTSNNSTVSVGHDFMHSTANNSFVSVSQNYTQSTGSNSTHTVAKDYSHETGNNATQIVGNDYTHLTGNSVNQDIAQNLNITIGNTGTMQAKQSITLRVGGNSLLINMKGIFINGTEVKVNE